MCAHIYIYIYIYIYVRGGGGLNLVSAAPAADSTSYAGLDRKGLIHPEARRANLRSALTRRP